jgi:DNA repair protein RecO (recombination protein O)
MRTALQPAYILHSRPYRDTSLILEVFTMEQGRLSLVAKGARRRARGGSHAALLQPFLPLLLSFVGRSELKTLTHVEAAGRGPALVGERLFSGMYLNELLVRLLHRHDPHPALFAAYGGALQALSEAGEPDPVLRRFEWRLLEDLGYSFPLAADGQSGEALRGDAWYGYLPEAGLVELGGAHDSNRPAYRGEDLLALSRGEFDGPVRQVAKRLMREALATHLGDAPLKSRELFRAQQHCRQGEQA